MELHIFLYTLAVCITYCCRSKGALTPHAFELLTQSSNYNTKTIRPRDYSSRFASKLLISRSKYSKVPPWTVQLICTVYQVGSEAIAGRFPAREHPSSPYVWLREPSVSAIPFSIINMETVRLLGRAMSRVVFEMRIQLCITCQRHSEYSP